MSVINSLMESVFSCKLWRRLFLVRLQVFDTKFFFGDWKPSLCPLFFIKFLFLTKWQPFKNYEKYSLFHLESSFRSWDIQIFLFSSSPLFLPVSHCFSGWLKINLKVYDATNCLNKNLIIHFIRYLEKEKRYCIETLYIESVLNKKHFYWKIIQKMCTRG